MTVDREHGWALCLTSVLRPPWDREETSTAGWPVAAIRDRFEAGAAQVVLLALGPPPGDVASLRRLLPEDEQERADRFTALGAAWRFVVGRMLMRSVLAAALGVLPRELHFRYSEHGKPSLADSDGLTPGFSLTHTEGLAGFALVRSGRIGIDIEAMRPLAERERFAARIFSGTELARFKTLPGRDQNAALLDAWTAKEAVLKAIGTGISGVMSTVELQADPGEEGSGRAMVAGENGPSTCWTFRRLPVPEGFHSALALEGTEPGLLVWRSAFMRGCA